MARLARLVVPGFPHHITQRGNRRQQTFFKDSDYQAYLDFMADSCQTHEVEIWAYCLMPNHVHLVAVPSTEKALRLAIGQAHASYTRMINSSMKWQGYLWQGRFSSNVMDEAYLLSAVRYIELNPVCAGFAKQPHEYKWSSARAHIRGEDNQLVKTSALLDIVGDWQEFLSENISEKHMVDLQHSHQTGRPLGGDQFIMKLEELAGRILRCQKPGPKSFNSGTHT